MNLARGFVSGAHRRLSVECQSVARRIVSYDHGMDAVSRNGLEVRGGRSATAAILGTYRPARAGVRDQDRERLAPGLSRFLDGTPDPLAWNPDRRRLPGMIPPGRSSHPASPGQRRA